MGLLNAFSKNDAPKEQYGIEDSAKYSELFGTTGIKEPAKILNRRQKDELFYQALDFCSSIENNYLANIQRGTLTKDGFFENMKIYLKDYCSDDVVIDEILTRLEKYIWGYYIIEDYINDDSVSDIRILDENRIRLKKKGKRINAKAKFKDEADYIRFVDIVCARNKISLTDINAIQTFTDAENNENARLRFNLTSGYINSSGKPIVQIRKVPKHKKSLQDLIDAEMFPPELYDYLMDKAKNSPGVIFTGKGASGKTTLMNAMLDHIPATRSGLVIQENDELFSNHPDLMFQHVVQSRGESRIQYTLKDLATNGLLTDLDYFIIGEIKGDEAAYFMNAAYTGHQCWTSVHGVNSQEAMNKLVDYVKYATDYPREDALRMLRFMNCIIFMKNFKIEEISEVVDFDEKTKNLKYKLIYSRKKGLINYE